MENQSLNALEKQLSESVKDYWSLFYLSGESDITAYEWARSQLIEVYEAVFWQVYDKPKKKLNLDRYIINEWLTRMTDERGYYEAKDDLLLLMSFGLGWDPSRICAAIGIYNSAYYHRLFEALRVRSEDLSVSAKHVNSVCAQVDLRSPEFFLNLPFSNGLHLISEEEFNEHVHSCKRCSKMVKDAKVLKKTIQKEWVKPVPEEVSTELLSPFEEIKNNPVRKSIWSKIPLQLRWTLVVIFLSTLIFLGFYYQGWQF